MNVLDYKGARRHVIELVSNVKMGLQPPFIYSDVHNPVARKLGVDVQEQELPFDEGLYISSDPPKIIIDSRITDSDRRNFTFFHELTHHLIKHDNDLIEFLNEYAYRDDSPPVEHLCNIGAAEFLAPLEEVRAIIQEYGFHISLIETLDQLYPASKPALTFQLATAAVHQCIVVICEYGFPTGVQERASFPFAEPWLPQPHLYVQYAATSPSFNYSCGRFATIPSNHIISAAYKDRCSLKGQASIPFKSGRSWVTHCDAHFYLGKVYAAFHVTVAPTREQLGFEFL